MVPILATVLKICGREVAIAAAQKVGQSAMNKFKAKVGNKATRAGVSHLRKNEHMIREAVISLSNKNSRSEAIKTLSLAGAGAIGATLAAKYAGQITHPVTDILANGSRTVQQKQDQPNRINHDSEIQHREQTRIKEETTQEKAIQSGYKR